MAQCSICQHIKFCAYADDCLTGSSKRDIAAVHTCTLYQPQQLIEGDKTDGILNDSNKRA